MLLGPQNAEEVGHAKGMRSNIRIFIIGLGPNGEVDIGWEKNAAECDDRK